MNETQFGDKVRRTLNQEIRIDPAVAERLRTAREQALARRREAPRQPWAEVLERLGGWSGLSLRVVLPVLALAVAVSLLVSGDAPSVEALAELDTLLLADELPIEAYLDKGFQAWLQREHGS